jgi:predicted nucleic acid-binding protein
MCDVTQEREYRNGREVCVVLDTNIWRSSQLLSDPVSAALLYALESVGARLGMPEVIEREVFKHGIEMGRIARNQIEKNLRIIRALVGESPGIELPTDEMFESAVTRRLTALEGQFHRIPFTAEVALRALDRVDLKLPPSHAGQQYKDSAIWEHCVDLAHTFEVHLVSADKAFYQQNSFQQGLETRLTQELTTSGISVNPGMESVLTMLTVDVADSLDAATAANAIQEAIIIQVRATAERSEQVVTDRQRSEFEAFVTEQPGVLSVTFELQYGLISTDPTLPESWITAEGQCLYRPASRETYEVKLSEITTHTRSESGISQRRNVFAHVSAIIGSIPPVPHQVREPLPGGSGFALIEVTDSASGADGIEQIARPPHDDNFDQY